VVLANLVGVGIGMLVLGMGLAPALLVASIFTSHTLLAYPVVSRLGLARDPAATTAVGAVIVTDTVSLLILAAVVGSTTGDTGTGFYLLLLGGFAAFAAAVFLLLPRLARAYFRRFANDRGAEYLFAVTVVLLAAVVGRVVGVQPILAAFFAGLALNRLIPESSTLMNRIGFFGSTLFIPAFLVSVGMLVDLRVFSEGPGVWRAALALVGGVTLTKIVGAKLVQRAYRYSAAQGWMIYGLSAPQAAGTLAVVLVGFDVGIFAADLLNGAVAMILVTCIAGPVVAQRSGRTVAREARRAPLPADAVPRRVLVPLVHPAAVDTLVDVAVMIRERDSAEAPVSADRGAGQFRPPHQREGGRSTALACGAPRRRGRSGHHAADEDRA
jgi:Kef-type K+ transport system membrane component KefB